MKRAKEMQTIVLLALLLAATCCSAAPSNIEPQAGPLDGIEFCAKQLSHLKRSDITGFSGRNHNCSVDCYTKLGTLITFFAEDGSACHEQARGYRCAMGKCASPTEGQLAPADTRNTVDTEDTRITTNAGDDAPELYSLEIDIVRARVPDEDVAPTAGGSDPFVLVEVGERGAPPSYRGGETLCHTYVVQDDNTPEWRGVTCKLMPVDDAAELKFMVYDSDKPIQPHDFLGAASATVRELRQGAASLHRLELSRGRGPSAHWLEVDVRSKRYEPPRVSQ